MNHLLLFEGFESSTLSRTLGFIDSSSRANFMENLKRIVSSLDFPLSNLSDDLFKYMPFKKALSIIPERNDGDDKFPNLIKFWFNTDGKFIKVTGNNGHKSSHYRSSSKSFSRDVNHYEIGKLVKFEDIKNLKNGTIVYAYLEGISVVSYKFTDEGGSTFLFQDSKDGSYSYHRNGISDFSWAVDNSHDVGNVYILEPMEDFIGFERELRYDHDYRISVYLGNDLNMQNMDVHFAIVLDFTKLGEKKYKKVGDIRSSRIDSKVGSLAIIDTETILKNNINRYMLQLSDRFNMDQIGDVSKVYKRALGGKNSLFFIISNKNSASIESLSSYIKEFMQDGNIERIDSIKLLINDIYKSAFYINKKIIDRENVAMSLFHSDPNRKKLEIYTKFKELSVLTYNAIGKYPTNTLAEVMIYIDRVSSIRRMLYNYRELSKLFTFVKYQVEGSYNPHEDISEIDKDYYDGILKDMESFKEVLQKM